jgi:hypothetical protein
MIGDSDAVGGCDRAVFCSGWTLPLPKLLAGMRMLYRANPLPTSSLQNSTLRLARAATSIEAGTLHLHLNRPAQLIASEVSIPAAPGNRGCHSNKIDEIAAA